MSNSDSPAGPTGGPVTLPGLGDLPEKLRVHALAKLLGRTSREVMAALLELVPWLKQWHNEVDPTYGYPVGDYIENLVLEDARALGLTPDALGDGTGKDGRPREVYLHHVVDNATTMREYGAQCVVWQTAVNPVVALELLATGVWSGTGVRGPEAFDAVPFLDLLAGERTERTELDMVRSKPLPFPPEPFAWAGIELTRRSLARADRNGGRRNLWLKAMDRVGLGFDS